MSWKQSYLYISFMAFWTNVKRNSSQLRQYTKSLVFDALKTTCQLLREQSSVTNTMKWVSCDLWTSYSKSKTKSKRLLWHVHRATNFFIYVGEFILTLIAHDTYFFQWLKYRCFLISITIFNYNKKRSRVVFPQSKIALFT